MSEASTLEAPGEAAGRGRRPLAPWIALAVAVVIGAMFVVLAGAKADTSDPTTGYLVDKPAPTVKTTTLDGQQFDLGRRKGSWVVLNFFDVTCAPCRQEHPELVKFAEQQAEPGSAGAELYTIINNVAQNSDETVREWFDDNGGDWPILHDDDGTIAVSFGMAQLPETWIVDPNGTIVARFPGQVTADLVTGYIQRFTAAGA